MSQVLNHSGEISPEEIQNSATVVVLDIPGKNVNNSSSSNNNNNNNNSGDSLSEETAATRIQATFRGHIVRKSVKSDTDSVFIRDEKDELSTIAIQLEPATPVLDETLHSFVVTTAINNAVEIVKEEAQAREEAVKEESIPVTTSINDAVEKVTEEAQAREEAVKEESIPVIELSQREEGENVSEHQQQPDKSCMEKDEVLWTSPAFATVAEQCTEVHQDKPEEPIDEKSDPDPQGGHISNAHPSDEVESIGKDEDSSQKRDSNSLSNQEEPEDGTNKSGSGPDKREGEDSTEQMETDVEPSSTQDSQLNKEIADGQGSTEVEPTTKIIINDGQECTTEVENTTDAIKSDHELPEIEPTKHMTEESGQPQDTIGAETTKVDGVMEATPGASQEESNA